MFNCLVSLPECKLLFEIFQVCQEPFLRVWRFISAEMLQIRSHTPKHHQSHPLQPNLQEGIEMHNWVLRMGCKKNHTIKQELFVRFWAKVDGE